MRLRCAVISAQMRSYEAHNPGYGAQRRGHEGPAVAGSSAVRSDTTSKTAGIVIIRMQSAVMDAVHTELLRGVSRGRILANFGHVPSGARANAATMRHGNGRAMLLQASAGR
jgi:hypothetical protein